jgi:hypothetical protein
MSEHYDLTDEEQEVIEAIAKGDGLPLNFALPLVTLKTSGMVTEDMELTDLGRAHLRDN